MKSYKKITNCKCAEYNEKLKIQGSKITCLEYDNEE